MNKIILDSPEYTIVTTDNKVYIIGNDGDSYSIIPKGLVDDMAKNLGLYDKYDTVIKELNDKIEICNRVINDRNFIIRNLKRNKEESIDKGSKDDVSDIPPRLCSKCSISKECNLYHIYKYKGFDRDAINLIEVCVSKK